MFFTIHDSLHQSPLTMFHRIPISLTFCLCIFAPAAFAQESPAPQAPVATQVSQADAANQAQPAPNAQPASPNDPQAAPNGQRPRRAPRVILNREFDDRDKIMLLLNAHCDFPSKEDLLSTSPDAEKHLHTILNDESVLFSVRMRAVEALAYFSTPQNIETIEGILQSPDDQEPLMLMQAIRAYPKVAPERAPAALAPYLASENDFIRFVTISSLKNCPGQAALSTLQSRYAVEKNRFFQARLKQAIDNHCTQDTYCN